MFVIFEGIDGSGKTTLSNRVARALRDRGLSVAHTREGGRFASPVTQAIRELGRDARLLALTPRSELLLYVARDVQLLEEQTLPARGRADVVLADRFLYTAEVLACAGRGLPVDEVRALIGAAARGVEPDLVILVDVDPQVARARRRVAKILAPDGRPSSRKGLAGAGMQQRLRAGYLGLAKDWLVVDNTHADLDELETILVDAILAARSAGRAAAVEAARARLAPPGPPPTVTTPAEARAAFLAWLDARAAREPALAAYFLAGTAGPGFDERREALAARAPRVVAAGLRGLDDAVSWRLREALKGDAPAEVARSLAGLRRLPDGLIDVVPGEVALALEGRDDEEAWTLRELLLGAAAAAVAALTGGLDSARAWALRERLLGEVDADTACKAVRGSDDARAWAVRAAAIAAAPVAALQSLAGLTSERAWAWRREHVERAPKIVLRSVDGLEDERAWALREATCLTVKEALDSMVGLDGPAAWRLREACAEVWASTVVKSLGPLAADPRGCALTARQLAAHPGNVSLWKHAAVGGHDE